MACTQVMERLGVTTVDADGVVVFDFGVLQRLLHERYQEMAGRSQRGEPRPGRRLQGAAARALCGRCTLRPARAGGDRARGRARDHCTLNPDHVGRLDVGR